MAELITPPNRLLAKVGRLGVGPDAVAKAEAALRDMAEQFDAWMESELLALEQARARCRALQTSPEALSDLYRCAHDLKGLGATYGYPLVTRIAASLSRLIDAQNQGAVARPSLIDAHVDAIQAVVRGRHRDESDPVGLLLGGELERQVAQT